MKIKRLSFKVIDQGEDIPENTEGWTGYLNQDKWDDWGEYSTQFYLTIVNNKKQKVEIGNVKIGSKGLKGGSFGTDSERTPKVSKNFDELSSDYFSLGQDLDYYENLKKLGDEYREKVLNALGDLAFDQERWNWAKEERVVRQSLLRDITKSMVEGQIRRMSRGDARVTKYSFSYTPPIRMGEGAPPYKLDFNVDPRSSIPTNVHVLIGRNGVGKTYLLTLMAKALAAKAKAASQSGKFKFEETGSVTNKFASVIAVSFSAFDKGELMPDRVGDSERPAFSFIGLRHNSKVSSNARKGPKSPELLAKEFSESLRVCRAGRRKQLWIEAIETLQSDPLFSAVNLLSLVEDGEEELTQNYSENEKSEADVFDNLSAGHKVVLLTVTKLVEKTEERTLVLLDEPEGHLHPPLISALIRTISELMVKTNGVAVIATHSPVILQEVPKSCVWILDKFDTLYSALRPSIETFAENVGVLSREVFQLELTKSGFHTLLSRVADEQLTYDFVDEQLKSSLGSEGRAVLRSMFLRKGQQD